jgi:hypothetical protein
MLAQSNERVRGSNRANSKIYKDRLLAHLYPKRRVDKVSCALVALMEQQQSKAVLELPPCARCRNRLNDLSFLDPIFCSKLHVCMFDNYTLHARLG